MARVPIERPGEPDPPIRRKSGKLQLQPQAQYGPAMQALTPRWRRFVYCYLANGGRNATKAYLEAGFGGDSSSAQPAASRLLHDKRIQAALREETQSRMAGLAPMAVHVVEDVMVSSLDHKEKMKAAQIILDRTGFMAAIAHKVEHTHTLDTDQMVAKIKAMCNEMGMDPQKLLGSALIPDSPTPLQVIDAEAIQVPEGLEDVF